VTTGEIAKQDYILTPGRYVGLAKQADGGEPFEAKMERLTSELSFDSTCKEYLQVQDEGSRSVSRNVKHYNLDVIISVGYRVKSLRGTQFRMWATDHLREYIVKGFTMNDDLLKKAGGGNYWKELLERFPKQAEEGKEI